MFLKMCSYDSAKIRILSRLPTYCIVGLNKVEIVLVLGRTTTEMNNSKLNLD